MTNAPNRRLAAILVADVVGFSRHTERDDAGTLAHLRAIRADVIDPAIADLHGRLVKSTGDGVLAEFASADAALRCAIRVQRALAERNAGVAPDVRIDLRIGVNLGDVIVDGDGDIFGDGVNVAARLEALAPPGGICIASAVRDQIHGNLGVDFVDAGDQQVKNIARPIRAFVVDLAGVPGVAPAPASAPASKLRAMSIGVCPLVAAADEAVPPQRARVATREFAAMLARSSSMVAVVPVPPALAEKAQDEPAAVGRAVAVRYLFEGDLHATSLHARVVDAASGEQVWSESATLPAESDAGAFARALHAVVWHLGRAVITAEIRRVLAEPLAQSTPVENVVRALALDRTEPDPRRRFAEKERLLGDALARDPACVPALIGLAIILDQRGDFDLAADPVALGQRMLELTAKAVRLNDIQPTTWFLHSAALMATGQWQAALEASAKAIRLEPFSSMLASHHAALTAWCGRPAEARVMLEAAIAANPQGAAADMQILCMVSLLLGNYREAVDAAERAIGLGANDPVDTPLHAAAAYAQLGDMAKAASALDDVLRALPGFTIATHRWRHRVAHPDLIRLVEQHLYPGLRKAGLPEG
ncbi:MAG: adenylate/guanylate cyclase domain-containing protein [Burkholderiales bacterium]